MKLHHVFCCLFFLSALMTPANTQSKAPKPLSVFPVEPFSLRNSDSVKNLFADEKTISLAGFINDWLVCAIAIRSSEEKDVLVEFAGDDALRNSVDLKIVGELETKDKRVPAHRLDPLFKDPAKLGDLSNEIKNWSAIRDFPHLHLKPNQTFIVWITVKTHSLTAGLHKGLLALSGDNIREKIPLEITIHPLKLPEENPIIGYAWTKYGDNEELARMAKDYGINTCGYNENWGLCKKAGFRFFIFNFSPSNQQEDSLKTSDEEILYYLKMIQETIAQLDLKPEQWAIEVYDEPSDPNAWTYAAWMIRMKRQWRGARFFANPGYSETNKNISSAENLVYPLRDYVDVWCPYMAYYYKVPSFIKALRETKKPLWFYSVEFSHERPLPGGRQFPWFAWRLKLDGWAFYGLKEWGDKNPWKDNVCARSYPNNTMSLWMEGLRQGVQDYKRLWVLQRAGVSVDEITSSVLHCVPKGWDAPWGGAEIETYNAVRETLDQLILKRAAGSNSEFRH